MTPELYLRRGLQYTFKIEGGNNAASAEFYHPFIITDEPVGGYNRLTKEQKSKVFVVVIMLVEDWMMINDEGDYTRLEAEDQKDELIVKIACKFIWR